MVITGASSGIGRAVALAAASHGGTVVVTAREQKALREVARECEEAGGRALAVSANVTEEEELQRVAQKAVETFGKIDVWINNAAVSLFGRFEETPLEDFRQVLETNLFGYLHGARSVLPYFREQGHGILINVSSVVGKVAQPFTSAYTTSKFAIDGFTESLRMELMDAPEIHVCTILPATIDTPLFQHAGNYSGKAVKAMDPVYSADDVATAVLKCIESPKREIVVGGAAKGMIRLRNLLPGTAEKMMARKVQQDHFQDKPARNRAGNLYKPSGSHSVSGGWTADGEEGKGGKAGVIAATTAIAAGLGAAGYYFSTRSRPRKNVRKAGRASQKTLSRAVEKARFW